MDNKSDKDFGKRKPVSVPVTPRPGPPAKRSGHVALLLMGTFAVGSAAYTLMPSQSCERPPQCAAALAAAKQCRRMPAAQLFLQQQPWRLRRQFVLAQQLLQQRFLIEPFIVGHEPIRVRTR